MESEAEGAEAGGGPAVSIIIPHYNDAERLRLCLDALAPQVGHRAEVVVVDNGSDTELSWIGRDFPFAALLTQPEKGAANARNLGVAHSRAPRLFFIDADCIPAPNWIAAGLEAIEGRAVVGGAVNVHDETPPPRSGAEALETVFAFDFRTYIERRGFTGAGNMLTWREIFDEVGDFRHGVSEDIDWSRRATAAGHAIEFAPDVVVSHPSRRDWAALRRKWLRITEEMFALRGSGARVRLAWALRAVAVLGSPLRDMPRLMMSPKLTGPGERLRGLATMLRLRALRCVWMLRQAAGFPIR